MISVPNFIFIWALHFAKFIEVLSDISILQRTYNRSMGKNLSFDQHSPTLKILAVSSVFLGCHFPLISCSVTFIIKSSSLKSTFLTTLYLDNLSCMCLLLFLFLALVKLIKFSIKSIFSFYQEWSSEYFKK